MRLADCRIFVCLHLMEENCLRDLQMVFDFELLKCLTGSPLHQEYSFGFLVWYSKACFQFKMKHVFSLTLANGEEYLTENSIVSG